MTLDGWCGQGLRFVMGSRIFFFCGFRFCRGSGILIGLEICNGVPIKKFGSGAFGCLSGPHGALGSRAHGFKGLGRSKALCILLSSNPLSYSSHAPETRSFKESLHPRSPGSRALNRDPILFYYFFVILGSRQTFQGAQTKPIERSKIKLKATKP